MKVSKFYREIKKNVWLTNSNGELVEDPEIKMWNPILGSWVDPEIIACGNPDGDPFIWINLPIVEFKN